ncbi:hypothetical protein [Streptomyces sp. I05A-00742]|uniref:hypothetical protein n=1 Tax=Streptomyces sp. I05A-00742 TaxID=2732853 RepID=UPI0037D9D422
MGLNDAPRRAHRDEALPGPSAAFANSGLFSTGIDSQCSGVYAGGEANLRVVARSGTASGRDGQNPRPSGRGACQGTAAYHDVTDHPLGKGRGIGDVRVDFVNGVDAKDGTTVSLRGLGDDGSLSATVGYDDVTGVGSPARDYVTSYAPGHRR